MKKHLTFLLLALFMFHSFEATPQSSVDSLEMSLELQNDLTKKAKDLFRLSIDYKYKNLDKSIDYCQRAIKLAKDIDNQKIANEAVFLLSELYWRNTDYLKAIEYANEYYNYSKDNNEKRKVARAYVMLGAIYTDLDNHDKSAEYYFKSLRLYEETNDTKNSGLVYNNIGKVFSEQGKFSKAEEYFLEALRIAEVTEDTSGIAAGLTNLASVYSNQKNYDKAKVYLEKAITINKRIGIRPWLGANYLNMGITSQKMDNMDTAIVYYHKALQVFEELNAKFLLTRTYYNMAQYYFNLNNAEKSMLYATKAFINGKKFGFLKAEKKGADILRQNYVRLGNIDSAYKYARIQSEVQDSLNIKENRTKLTKLEMQFNIEKEQQVVQIKQQKKDFFYIILFIGLLLIIVLAISFAYTQRIKAKNNQLEIESMEIMLKNTNKELTTSAMYLMKKNELLANISQKIIEIEKEAVKEETKGALHKIADELQKNRAKDTWEEFELRFNQVHVDYYQGLKHKFPDLTPNDLRLCALLKLNMSTKEISDITGQRLGTIEMARSRIRKKIGITGTDTNLIDFLGQI